jgi:hypothetical protein
MATVALALLPASIKSLALGFHSEFLALQQEIQCRSETKDRLLQADFVPVSVCIKFKLTTSNSVKEHPNDELTSLSELTDGRMTFYQSSIKQELIKLVQLELKLAKNALNKQYCKSVAALGITMAIHHPDVNMAHSKDLIALVFEEDPQTL